jgi:indole-3-glycerol phosphate synthase
MTILDKIIATKREELAAAQARFPESQLAEQAEKAPPTRSFAAAIQGDDIEVIAEIKKASPSAGVIREDFDPAFIADSYERGGAAALSVLTDETHFQGSLDHLREARAACSLPVLRKDFTIAPHSLLEARCAGADAVLLIVAVLDDALLRDLITLAGELGLAALVEVHDPPEADRALAAGAKILGINNRDLRTFTTDIAQTEKVLAHLPSREGLTIVSESGIRSGDDLRRLRDAGVHAALIGEHLMLDPLPGTALAMMLADSYV